MMFGFADAVILGGSAGRRPIPGDQRVYFRGKLIA